MALIGIIVSIATMEIILFAWVKKNVSVGVNIAIRSSKRIRST